MDQIYNFFVSTLKGTPKAADRKKQPRALEGDANYVVEQLHDMLDMMYYRSGVVFSVFAFLITLLVIVGSPVYAEFLASRMHLSVAGAQVVLPLPASSFGEIYAILIVTSGTLLVSMGAVLSAMKILEPPDDIKRSTDAATVVTHMKETAKFRSTVLIAMLSVLCALLVVMSSPHYNRWLLDFLGWEIVVKQPRNQFTAGSIGRNIADRAKSMLPWNAMQNISKNLAKNKTGMK